MSDDSGMISTPPWLTGGAPQLPPAPPPAAPPVAPAPSVPLPVVGPLAEATTIVQRGAQGWTLGLADGRSIRVDGVVLVGRDPANSAEWPNAELVSIDDPERSVSKTHAAFVLDASGLSVVDLHSTNGVAMVGAAGVVEVTAGVPVVVAPGYIVELGKYPVRIDAR